MSNEPTGEWIEGISGLDELEGALREADQEERPQAELDRLPEGSSVKRLCDFWADGKQRAQELMMSPMNGEKIAGKVQSDQCDRRLSIASQFTSLHRQLTERGTDPLEAVQLTESILKGQAILSSFDHTLALTTLTALSGAFYSDNMER